MSDRLEPVKVVVTRMPTNPEDCPFSEEKKVLSMDIDWNEEYHYYYKCNLLKSCFVCGLDSSCEHKKCEMLITEEEYHNDISRQNAGSSD